MDLSKYLPVSIVQTVGGVFIVCALLGLATFFVQDWMSSLLRWRYDLLADTIRNMLADSDLTKRFFDHPLIQSLNVQHHKTNYISGKQFAEVLFDLIMSDDIDSEQTSQTKSIGTFEKLTQSLNKIKDKNPALVRALNAKLLGISNETNTNQNLFQEAINRVAEWYDQVMDRLNNAYISRLQLANLYIALVLAIVLNVDTIEIGNYLWREPIIQQVLVENAAQFEMPRQELAANPEEAMQAFRDQFVGLNLPIGWSISNIPQSIRGWVFKFGGIILSGVIAAIAAPFLRSLLYRKTSYEVASFFTPSLKKQDD